MSFRGERLRDELSDLGCLHLDTGHQFIGRSKKHLTGYCNVDPGLTNLGFLSRVGVEMAATIAEFDVETVVAPAVGGIVVGYAVANSLKKLTGRDISVAFADRTPNGLEFNRSGFKRVVRGKRIAAVDDMVNTSFSARQLVDATRAIDGDVQIFSAIAANEGVTAETFDVPEFDHLTEVVYENWTEAECQERGPCSEGWPISIDEALGHGDEYVLIHPDYPGGYRRLLPVE